MLENKMRYIKNVKDVKQEDLEKINNSLVQFDRFIQRITRIATDEHISIYEHWIDCMDDIKKLIVEEK